MFPIFLPFIEKDSIVYNYHFYINSALNRCFCRYFSLAMKKIKYLLLAILTTNFVVHAQDSLIQKVKQPADSILTSQNKKLDSLQYEFNLSAQRFQESYKPQLLILSKNLAKLNQKKDSLTHRMLPATFLSHQIDSLVQARTKSLRELQSKIEKTKKETLTKIPSLHLPPEATHEIDAFTKSINGFTFPNIPSWDLPQLEVSSVLSSGLSLPNINNYSLQNLHLNKLRPPSFAAMETALSSRIKEVQNVKNRVVSQKAIEEGVLKVAEENAEIKSFLKEKGNVANLEKQISEIKNKKSIDSMAMEQLKPSLNHFEGKGQELRSAMTSISKIKDNYADVTSLANLPRKPPNELKGKPWQERTIVGLNYFILTKNSLFADFNPYIGWRFNPKITAYLGWNERMSLRPFLQTTTYDRVYGVRGAVSYTWQHGISFTVAPEVMSAYVPTDLTLDQKNKALVWGAYTGVRKNYPLGKKFTCYSEVLYNFNYKSQKNIYNDRVVFRFGMEFKLRN